MEILKLIKKITEQSLELNNIQKKSRKRELVDGRKIYCLIAKDYTNHTLNAIGKEVNVDHSTALFSISKSRVLIKSCPLFKEKFYTVMDSLPITIFKEHKKPDYKTKNARVLEIKIEVLNKRIIMLEQFIKNTRNQKLKDKFTNNEIAYRKLTKEQQYLYNTRVSAMLKMMTLINAKENSKFEIINCQA